MSTKRSISVAIRSTTHPGTVLLVQRPDDDEDLPGVWGLPAASLTDGESWEDAVRRAARDKLGVSVRVGSVLEEGSAQRPHGQLHMRLYEAGIEEGTPVVPQPVPGVTQYQAWRWAPPADVVPAAARGSLCSQLLLRSVLVQGHPAHGRRFTP